MRTRKRRRHRLRLSGCADRGPGLGQEAADCGKKGPPIWGIGVGVRD